MSAGDAQRVWFPEMLASEGVVTDAEFRRLDQDWKKRRAALRLDCFGRIAHPSEPSNPRCCGHL